MVENSVFYTNIRQIITFLQALRVIHNHHFVAGRENKPETAIDHLHTYCMKKFAHLLLTRGITCSENDALHARFGKYRKALIAEREIQTFTGRAMKSAISLFDSFNDIRNYHSLAHDNIILDPAEARFVFETVSAVLVFLRAVEAGRYET